MNTQISTKFTVASEKGIRDLMEIIPLIAREKLAGQLPDTAIEAYIVSLLQPKPLVNKLNSLSNQWLIVYAGDQPAGYTCITSQGKKPAAAGASKSIQLADFGIVQAYQEPAIQQALLDKALSVCRLYEKIWIQELTGSPLLVFLAANGFIQQATAAEWNDLSLPSFYLIKDQPASGS